MSKEGELVVRSRRALMTATTPANATNPGVVSLEPAAQDAVDAPTMKNLKSASYSKPNLSSPSAPKDPKKAPVTDGTAMLNLAKKSTAASKGKLIERLKFEKSRLIQRQQKVTVREGNKESRQDRQKSSFESIVAE